MGGGRHLKLKVSREEKTFETIFFSTNAAACGLKVGDRADVAFYPQFNEFRGTRTVQLQVVDLRPARTRAQCEKALYDKMNAGEDITPKEAAALLPSRTEFANLWRYLRVHASAGPIEGTGCRLAKCVARECGGRPVLMRTLVCLDVLNERGLSCWK
ncbi:hypothetical protein SDC9_68903 [bioreactor metagenome]|uniref:RecJ OB domain-containing protein n=1 Tax=bioreactor metagenome TaxID=1076179 RepID=A0A644Y374_9ZZZZ